MATADKLLGLSSGEKIDDSFDYKRETLHQKTRNFFKFKMMNFTGGGIAKSMQIVVTSFDQHTWS